MREHHTALHTCDACSRAIPMWSYVVEGMKVNL